jgi:hypothetical protein
MLDSVGQVSNWVVSASAAAAADDEDGDARISAVKMAQPRRHENNHESRDRRLR